MPAPVCHAAVSAGRMLLPQNLAVGMWRGLAIRSGGSKHIGTLWGPLGHAVHHLNGISQQKEGGVQLFGCSKKSLKAGAYLGSGRVWLAR